MAALYFAVQMTLMMFGGFLLRRTGRVDDSAAQPLTRLFIDLVIPCMIVNAMATSPFSMQTLHNGAVMVALGLVYFLVVGAITFLLTSFNRKNEFVNQHRFAMLMPNFTAMGAPITEALYGAQGILYNTMMGLSMRIILYISVPVMFRRKREKTGDFRENMVTAIKSLGIPPVYATILGFLLFVTQFKPPVLIMSTLGIISKMSLPLGIILCGIVIGGIPKGVRLHASIVWVSLFRNFVAPALMLAVVLVLKLDVTVAKTAVIMAALPIAMVYSTFCVEYDTQPQQASLSILLSTSLSALTIPLWQYLLEMVY